MYTGFLKGNGENKMDAQTTFKIVDTALYSVIIPLIALTITVLSFSYLSVFALLLSIMLAIEKHNTRKNKTYA